MLVLPAPLWRFLILDDQVMRNKCVLIRDTDSRPIRREAAAVHAWLHTNKTATCIRDHPCHDYPLQAGLWGAHVGQFQKLITPNTMRQLLTSYNLNNGYLTDQLFLQDKVWPLVQNDIYCSDSYYCTKFSGSHPFPVSRSKGEHCGGVYDTNDILRESDAAILLRTPEPPSCRPQR